MALNTTSEKRFNGILTHELREFIRRRRRTLGVTLQQLSSVLRVSWSTLRKWEDGSITRCHHSHVYRLSKFLAGDYDEELRKMSTPVDPLQPKYRGRTSPMLAWMERAATFFSFCEHYPAVRNELMGKIKSVIEAEASKLMQNSAGSAKVPALKISQEQEICR
ncbi:MAG: hypothetical protein MJ106_02500 [Lentisphaeria bacterium]|nr:hypothetical protein [Lentisphaeria bacterium]